MTAIARIQKELDAATERVAILKRSLRANPELPSIAANLETAQRLREKFAAQLREAKRSSAAGVNKRKAKNTKRVGSSSSARSIAPGSDLLLAAKKFVDSIGNIDRAKAAVDLLAQLRG